MMLSQERHREIVTGTGLASGDGLLRVLLGMAAIPFWMGTSARNAMFDLGLRTAKKVNIPVVSIGNITTGGTGKTPVVALVCELCRELGIAPGIISRGYRSLDGQANDEKLLLELLLPDVPHVQNRQRILAAEEILRSSDRPAPGMLVMDDGFQHRQLHRDLDIVLIDATNPFGYERLLPRGLLREPLESLKRADVVLLTRANQVSNATRATLLQQLQSLVRPGVPVLSVSFEPTQLVGVSGEIRDIAIKEKQIVTAFCGIGAPENFFATIRKLGLKLDPEQTIAFPDHHHYTATDLERVRKLAHAERSDAVLMTLKDLVKVRPLMSSWREDAGFKSQLWALDIAAVMPEQDRERLKQRIEGLSP